MKLLFEPNLRHQREAVSAVVSVFEGALDTTKKFELQTAFKDNFWVV